MKVKEVLEGEIAEIETNPRYVSFDYCYGYFQSNKGQLAGDNMEISCLRLWAYLASWGMMRNQKLLQNSNYKVLENTIITIEDIFRNSEEIPDIEED